MSARTNRTSSRAMSRYNMLRATARLRKEIGEIIKVIPAEGDDFSETRIADLEELFNTAFNKLEREWLV